MKAPERLPATPRVSSSNSTSPDARDPGSSTPESAAAYAYDPTLCIHDQHDLDRLRCLEDRELAGVLYSIYVLSERNRCRGRGAPAPSPRPAMIGLRVLATRALAGELGFAAQELATNLLIDESGRELEDERSLREFGRAFQKLPRRR